MHLYSKQERWDVCFMSFSDILVEMMGLSSPVCVSSTRKIYNITAEYEIFKAVRVEFSINVFTVNDLSPLTDGLLHLKK